MTPYKAPALVGLLVLVTALTSIFFVQQTSKDKFSDQQTYRLHVLMQDASGIRWKTRVQINGIDAGKIIAIQHRHVPGQGLLAQVTMRIHKDFPFYANATIEKTTESLLGDYRLDAFPGTPDARPMQDNETLPHPVIPSAMDETKQDAAKIAANLAAITESLRQVLGGEQGQSALQHMLTSLQATIESVHATATTLEQTIGNNQRYLHQTMGHIAQMTQQAAKLSGPQGEIEQLLHSLNQVSANLEQLLSPQQIGHRTSLDPNQADPSQPAGALRQSIDDLQATSHHLASITDKIDHGQGTVGRLLNDNTIVNKVEETLDSAGQLVQSIAGIETELELRSEYIGPLQSPTVDLQAGMKNTLGLRLRPKPDKYYLIEAISDTRGVQTRNITNTRLSPENQRIVADTFTTTFNALKYTFMFAKRYYFATFRFGIIENSGGLGLNLHALHDTLEFRLDVHDFDRRNPLNAQSMLPRLRATGLWQMADHIHLQAGFDDPLNANVRAWFVGGALRFTDLDLKGFLTLAPRP